MKSLVVYESLYGNTEAVARAVADGLREQGDALVAHTDEVDAATLAEVDLLVVGAPTHAWGLPRERTWQPKDGPVTPHPRLLREWLSDLPDGRGRPAAAFATRIDKPEMVTGSAVGGLARRLRRRGWTTSAGSTSFLVAGTEGPLDDGELARARLWGAHLGRTADRKRIGSP